MNASDADRLGSSRRVLATRDVRTVACLVGMALLTGCGRSGPDLVPVRGILTLDGRPVAMRDVVFAPATGTPGSGSVGRTQDDGTFELVAVVGGATQVLKGARPGRYRVWIAVAELYDADGIPRPVPAAIEALQIPPLYTNPELTPFRVEVTTGMPDVMLNIKSK